MRIADVLMERERGNRKMREKQPRSCLSPRLLLFGWVSSKTKKRTEKIRESHISSLPPPASLGFIGPQTPDYHVSGEHAKRECVNLAVGFGLFYLIAASKNELNKMVELRREMEMLVQSTKDKFQIQNTKLLNEPSESHTNRNCSNVDAHESLCSAGHFSIHDLSYENQTETLTSYSCEQSLTINTDNNGKCVEEIDELEAELENELKRLQVRMDTSYNPRHQRSKMHIDDSISSSSESFIEVVNIEETDRTEQFGVCPHQLEKKLHELLQSRQQDKIEELEAALKRANQKLLEKEREVSWWRDTAKIFSHHVPKAARLLRLGQSSHRIN